MKGSATTTRKMRFGLQWQLSVFSVLLILVAVSVSSFISYRYGKSALAQALAKELLAIVSSTAPFIEGDTLDVIRRQGDGAISGQEEFDGIRDELVKVRDRNLLRHPRGSPLYVMRPVGDPTNAVELEFVVMTDRDKSGNFFVGNSYPLAPHLRTVLGGTPAATGVYEDSEGVWISAAAPIFRRDGSLVGVLQADREIGHFYAEARKQALAILRGAGVSILLAAVLALVLAGALLSPIRRLADAARLFGEGRLDHRVQVKRSDELGELASRFNLMAEQIEAARQDIEAQKQELIEAYEQSQSASRAKSEFLATMSHEIRTPMNGIIGFASLLLDTHLSREQRGQVELVQQSATNLLTIINDILDLSRIEAGRFHLEAARFDLRDLVEGVVDLLAVGAHRKNVEVTLWFDEQVPIVLIGDATRLRQVLLNLTGNAVKFTHEGDVLLKVTREPSRGHDELRLRFEIRDTGIGISADAQARLFQPFGQADSSTTRRYGGTGLGLVICRRLVEMMGGEIGFASELGKGSQFWFTARFDVGLEIEPHPLQVITSLAGRRILIIDDNETNRLLLRQLLRLWDVEADSADSAAAALHSLGQAMAVGAPYDLAILDLQMPNVDGLELARQIHRDPALTATRLMMLSSTHERPSEEVIREAGLLVFLQKPLKRRQFEHALAEAFAAPVPGAGPTVAPAARERPEEVRSGDGAAPVVAHPLRILIAEDHPTNSLLAIKLLERIGYRADLARDGQEVLELTDLRVYDVVLMDCLMPEIDGYEATRRLREREKATAGVRLQIIAMTASAMREDRDRCLASGMDDYLTKPVKREELRGALERAQERMKTSAG